MNNVLFSVRCRFDAVDRETLSPELREALDASRRSVDYLQRLCDGLRWLAVDPDDDRVTDEVTVLRAWWDHVQPLMAQMITNTVSLEADLPSTLPPVSVAPHRLTQAVMNLLVNAAEATRGSGLVQVAARHDPDARQVHLEVTDNGVGMSEAVRVRAFDPFFTTKKRSLSTGLGLSLVHGVVSASHGSTQIDSTPGRGTTVTLSLPVAKAEAAVSTPPPRGPATVSLADPLRAEWVAHVVRLAGYQVEHAVNGEPVDGTRLWVTEPASAGSGAARRFRERGGGQVILLGAGGPEWHNTGAVVVEDPGSLDAIRAAVRAVTEEGA
jgi:hypothetical protein